MVKELKAAEMKKMERPMVLIAKDFLVTKW